MSDAAHLICAGLELGPSWAWYWWLLIAVVADLILATIVYASYVWWNSSRRAREAAALQQLKLGQKAAGQGKNTANAPVNLTASATATGRPASNPYYSRSYTPGPGLQQPLKANYAYPGAPTR